MKRRSLLSLLPAASALVALRSEGRPVPQPVLTAAGFAISVQCWSFRRFTLWQAIEKTAESGAAAAEFYPGQPLGGPHGELKLAPGLDVDVYRSLLDHSAAHGITPMNLGVVDIPAKEADARPFFELAKTLGLYGLTTESTGSIDTLEALAREYDLKVCFHNHPRPTKLWHPDTVWQLVEKRHENLGYCADLGHWASSGLDPLAVVRKIAPRVRAFHFKDRGSIAQWTHDRPFGTGVIDLPAILDEARKHGFAGNVSIEYEHNWENSVPDIAQCVGYLRAYAKLRS